jgi:branched-chain amino acid transport system substrate-binding protein
MRATTCAPPDSVLSNIAFLSVRVRSFSALAVMLLFAACAPKEPPVIRVGLIGMFIGQMGPTSGIPAREGARLAVDEINSAGGVMINGVAHRIELIEREVDDRPDAAALAARSLINLDSVDAIIGPQISALAIGAAPVAEASEVLMISPMASNPAVTAGRRFVFRLAFVDAFQGAVLARFAYDSLSHRRAAILHDAASAYGRDISRLFKETFESLGGRVVGIETFNVDDPADWRPQLRRLLARNPDAMLLPNFAQYDSAQVRQARELGFRGRFLGSDSWDVRALAVRNNASGSIVVGNWDRQSSRDVVRTFIAKWELRHPEPARATGAATYDAVHLIALAMSRAGTKRSRAVADSLRNFGMYEGVISPLDFRGSNDPVRGAAILEVSRNEEVWVRGFVPPPPR